MHRFQTLMFIWACCWLNLSPALAQDHPQTTADKPLVIGTQSAPPFVIKNDDGTWSGISMILWKNIAADLNLDYTLQELDLEALLKGVQDGSLDAAITALTITAEREEILDFSHSFHSTGLSMATTLNTEFEWLRIVKRIFSKQFLQAATLLTFVLLLLGVLIWICERRRNPDQVGPSSLRGIGAGFWWAAVTMTTVGYGDRVPVTVLGRLLALVWMFTALILAASFIATFSAAFTISELESTINGPEELYRFRVGAIKASTSDHYLQRRGIIARLYLNELDSLRAITEKEIDMMIHDAPILQYLIKEHFGAELEVLPLIFERQDYGIAFPSYSPWRDPINQVLLRIISQPAWQSVLQQYLGARPN